MIVTVLLLKIVEIGRNYEKGSIYGNVRGEIMSASKVTLKDIATSMDNIKGQINEIYCAQEGFRKTIFAMATEGDGQIGKVNTTLLANLCSAQFFVNERINELATKQKKLIDEMTSLSG